MHTFLLTILNINQGTQNSKLISGGKKNHVDERFSGLPCELLSFDCFSECFLSETRLWACTVRLRVDALVTPQGTAAFSHGRF